LVCAVPRHLFLMNGSFVTVKMEEVSAVAVVGAEDSC
jgi:hypothetical protein